MAVPLEEMVRVGRQAAELFAMIAEEGDRIENVTLRMHFFDKIRQLAIEKNGGVFAESNGVPSPERMTDEEASRFGQQVLGFGIHKGKKIDDIPLGYLQWLAGNATEYSLKKKINAFLGSPRMQREQEAASD